MNEVAYPSNAIFIASLPKLIFFNSKYSHRRKASDDLFIPLNTHPIGFQTEAQKYCKQFLFFKLSH